MRKVPRDTRELRSLWSLGKSSAVEPKRHRAMKQEPGRQQPGILGLQAGEDVKCRLKDALVIDQQMEPPEDEGLFEPDGGVECPEMDEEIIERFFNECESVPF